MDCAPLQLCVDDACVRHERLPPGELSWGEVRRRPLRELLAASGDPLPRPWTSFQDGTDHDIRTWTVPGPAGESLLFTVDSETACPIIVANPGLRSAWIDDLRCTALALGADGQLWAAGLEPATQRPIIVELDADDTEVARHDLATALDSAIGEATSFTRRAGPVTSMMMGDGQLYISMRLAAGDARDLPADAAEVVFVAIAAGRLPELVDVGGQRVFEDSEGGWLVPAADGSAAALVITRHVGDITQPTPLDLLALGTGTRERWRDDYGHNLRYAVSAAGEVDALIWPAGPSCTLQWMHDGEGLAERDGYIFDSCSRGMQVRPYDVPIAQYYSAPIGHVAYAGVHVSEIGTATEPTTSIRLMDHALVDRREVMPSSDAPYLGSVAVARFGLAIEGVLGVYPTGEAFDWFEFAIHRSATP